MAKQKIKHRVDKQLKNIKKKEIQQLTIKVDNRINFALTHFANSFNISKNKLVEDILYDSGIIEEVDENYL